MEADPSSKSNYLKAEDEDKLQLTDRRDQSLLPGHRLQDHVSESKVFLLSMKCNLMVPLYPVSPPS